MKNEHSRIDEYRFLPEYYDDNIMRQSEKLSTPGEYNLFNNNCQHYADKLRENYAILKDSPEIRRELERKIFTEENSKHAN